MRPIRPSIDADILANLGTAARTIGLPMHQAVLLGHDEDLAVGFIASVIHGTHGAFLANVDWDMLRSTMHAQVGTITV